MNENTAEEQKAIKELTGRHRKSRMRKLLKKILWVVGCGVLILLLTNPSISQFTNYAKLPTDIHNAKYRRTANYFLFSYYMKEWTKNGFPSGESESEEYVGIFGNFYLQ